MHLINFGGQQSAAHDVSATAALFQSLSDQLLLIDSTEDIDRKFAYIHEANFYLEHMPCPEEKELKDVNTIIQEWTTSNHLVSKNFGNSKHLFLILNRPFWSSLTSIFKGRESRESQEEQPIGPIHSVPDDILNLVLSMCLREWPMLQLVSRKFGALTSRNMALALYGFEGLACAFPRTGRSALVDYVKRRQYDNAQDNQRIAQYISQHIQGPYPFFDIIQGKSWASSISEEEAVDFLKQLVEHANSFSLQAQLHFQEESKKANKRRILFVIGKLLISSPRPEAFFSQNDLKNGDISSVPILQFCILERILRRADFAKDLSLEHCKKWAMRAWHLFPALKQELALVRFLYESKKIPKDLLHLVLQGILLSQGSRAEAQNLVMNVVRLKRAIGQMYGLEAPIMDFTINSYQAIVRVFCNMYHARDNDELCSDCSNY